MAAVVVVLDYEIHDQQLYESVTARIAELVEAHGGKYLARGAPAGSRGPGEIPAAVTVMELGSVEDVDALNGQRAMADLVEQRRKAANSVRLTIPGV